MPYAYTKALPRQGQQVGRKTHHEYDAAPLGAVYRWRTHFNQYRAPNGAHAFPWCRCYQYFGPNGPQPLCLMPTQRNCPARGNRLVEKRITNMMPPR